MKRLLIITFGIFLPTLVFAQQWERLPLNGGQLDKLVQNPFDEREIVGCIQDGDIFHSVDGGVSWKTIVQDPVQFQRSYHRLTWDKLGRLYLMTHWDGLWRSSDRGTTWQKLPVPGGTRYSNSSRTSITEDGTIFVWEDSTPSLYRSRNDGQTWDEISPGDIRYDMDFFVDPNNSEFLVVLERESLDVSKNGGSSWDSFPLAAPAHSALFTQMNGGKLCFRFFSGIEIIEVHETHDTGRTWQRATSEPIQVSQGDCNSGFLKVEKSLRSGDSTEYILYCHTLHRSTDFGRTFAQITDFRVEDIIQAGNDLIASVPIRGLIRSTDLGDTWVGVCSPPALFNFAAIEFAHAQDDTLFALLSGEEFNGAIGARFMESDDGGDTWRSLFFTYGIHALFVDAGRPARYYLHSGVPDDRYGDPQNRYTLLSGVAGQSVPDTILVTTSIPKQELHPPSTFECRASERFPGWIYAAKHSSTIGWSSDRGENWEWHAIPISISKVTPWPSQRDPLKVVAAAWETDPMVPMNHSGLYFTSDGGLTFSNVSTDIWKGFSGMGGMFTSPDDRYFMNGDASSADYGLTWFPMRDGLDSVANVTRNFQSHGQIITATNAGMYVFGGDRWTLLRDREGHSIWTREMQGMVSRKMDLELAGDILYVLLPSHGLYRIKLGPITDVEPGETPTPRTPVLEIYPNPALERTHIFWNGLEDVHNATVRIYDFLGRTVWEYTIELDAGTTTWPCVRRDGTLVPPGIYHTRLVAGDEVLTTKFLVIR